MKKIAFLSHLDLNLYLFRLPIMKALVEAGNTVYAICPKGDKFELFQEYGIQALSYQIERKSLNPLKEMITIRNIYRIIEPLKLDILQNFTVKANIYGTIAAKVAHVPIILNAVTGLGSFYIESNLKSKLVRFIIEQLYLIVNKRIDYCIFQNTDDMNYFINKGLIDKNKAILIRGSGIDTQFFQSQNAHYQNEKIKVLMIARAIWHKGIKEYYEAANILKQKNIEFILIGDTDEGNISCASIDFLKNNDVVWLGHRDDIKEQIDSCDIFVLPSYREGLPRTLLEAASMAKPIVTTNSIGCKEVVKDHYNGFLVPIGNSTVLANRIKALINDSKLRRQMGNNSRKKVIEEFSIDLVVSKYLEVYNG